MQTESHPRGHGSLLVASLWQTANVSWDSDSSYKILLKFYPKKRTKVGDCENQRRFSRSGSQGMIHAQCEEMGNRNIWKKSWHDKTAATHGKGRVCAGPYHPPNGKRTSPGSTDKHAWPRELEPDTTEPWSPAFSEMQYHFLQNTLQ